MKRRQVVWLAVALAAVCLTYSNAWQNGFHFDDSHTIVDNPAIRSLTNIPRFFTDATTFSVLPANRTYRPVVSSSLAFDYFLGRGLNPVFFHLSTFCVFLLQILAMQVLFQALLDRAAPAESNWIPSLLASAWYGVHPAIAQTVNYIIQRGDIYSTFGVVAALVLYIKAPRLRRTGLYLLPFVIAMLSKPPAVVFPVLLFAYLAMFEAPRSKWLSFAAVRCIPSLLTAAGLMWLQSAMTPKSYLPSTLSSYSYWMTQPYVLLRYFGSLFLPVHLNADTDLAPFASWNAAALAGVLFVAALIAGICWFARRDRWRPVSYGLLWFLVASLPTSVYRLSEVENDHRMYMPFVGLVLAIVWGGYLLIEAVAPSRRRAILRWCATAAVLLLGLYAWGAHLRNRVWLSEESLWLDDIQKCPHNGRGLMNYGLTQMAAGRYEQALTYFNRALLYTPNYPALEINLGIDYAAMGQQPAADQHFQRALQLAPADDEAHFYYGRALLQDGHPEQAVAELRLAWQLNPARPENGMLLMQALADTGSQATLRQVAQSVPGPAPADQARAVVAGNAVSEPANYWIDLSLRRWQQGDFAGSIAAARHALSIDPRSAAAWNNIGAAWAGLSQWDAAIAAEQTALRLQPDLAVARNNLALYLQRQMNQSAAKTPEDYLNASLRLNQAGHYRESIAAARKALQLRPGYPEAWNNLAAGYAALDQWDQAIHAAQEAIRLKPDFQLARNNLAWALREKENTSGRLPR